MRISRGRTTGLQSLGTRAVLQSLGLLFLWGGSVLAAEKSASDYYVHSLPGQPDGPLLKMHAG